MSDYDVDKIGQRIYRLRTEKNITQRALAKKLYVTNRAVSRWECGRGHPDITLLPKIAEIFGITTDELLGGDKPQAKENTRERTLLRSLKKEREELCAAKRKIGRIRYAAQIALAACAALAAFFAGILQSTYLTASTNSSANSALFPKTALSLFNVIFGIAKNPNLKGAGGAAIFFGIFGALPLVAIQIIYLIKLARRMHRYGSRLPLLCLAYSFALFLLTAVLLLSSRASTTAHALELNPWWIFCPLLFTAQYVYERAERFDPPARVFAPKKEGVIFAASLTVFLALCLTAAATFPMHAARDARQSNDLYITTERDSENYILSFAFDGSHSTFVLYSTRPPKELKPVSLVLKSPDSMKDLKAEIKLTIILTEKHAPRTYYNLCRLESTAIDGTLLNHSPSLSSLTLSLNGFIIEIPVQLKVYL